MENTTCSTNEASSVAARPFRRVVVISNSADGRAKTSTSRCYSRDRRCPVEEQVPRPRSAVILGMPPPLPAATDHLRRLHTEGSPKSVKQLTCTPIVQAAAGTKPCADMDQHPWSVKEIPLNPPYPVERTHEILRHISPSIIANRIAACLRNHSIGAVYDDKNATCIAETSDLTKFYVRLFRCAGDEKDDAVLVEVQRRCGSCTTFHDAARIVLAAAKGLPSNDTSRAFKDMMSSKPRSIPASMIARAEEFMCTSRRCSREDSKEEKNKGEVVLADLECVNCLLHKDRIDAHLLALESLRFLTDVQSTDVDVAAAAAKTLIAGEGVAAEIRNAVLSLVLHGTLDTNESRCPHDCDVDICFDHALHDHALAVLANSIGLLAKNFSEVEPPVVLSESNDLLAALAEDIADAEKKPNDAYEASRCMNKLLEASDAAKLDAEEQGVLTLITAMQQSGVCRHALMERELRAAAESLSHVV